MMKKRMAGWMFMFCMVMGLCMVDVAAQDDVRRGYIFENNQWVQIPTYTVGDGQVLQETAVSVSVNSVSGNSTKETGNQCGETLYWNLDAKGVMTISGTGEMWDFINDPAYYVYHECPWESRKAEIKSVKFESGITYIGAGAFMGCENLKNVTFADTIEVIGFVAFWNCKKLENFVLPAGLRTLGQQCFDGCETITKVVIPDTVNFLDGQIFSRASSLKELYIGGSLDAPGYMYAEECIGECVSLEEIKVSANNIALTAIDGILYSKDKVLLVQYPAGKKDKKVVLPLTLKRVGQFTADGALYLEEVVFPEGLVEVGICAFRRNPKLKYLSYPSTVKSVEEMNGNECKEIVYIENKSETVIPLPTGNASVWVDENDKVLDEMGKGTAYKKGVVSRVYLKKEKYVMGVGEQMILPLTEMEYWNDEVKESREDLIYKSSNSRVVSVSKDGTLTAKKTGTVTITIDRRYTNSGIMEPIVDTCKIVVKKNIADAKVTGVKNQIYTGKAFKPVVKVTLDKKTLKKGKDYTVSYKNNKNIGTATVVIKGKGSYAGKVEKTFKITVRKGSVYTIDKVTYKITNKKTNGKGTVTLTGVTNPAAVKKLTVGSTVEIGGVKFKITAIGVAALKNCKKLLKVEIGENVKKIEKQAFQGSKKLKTIVVKSEKLTSIGANAISGIHAKAQIQVPAAKVKAYKKLLKKTVGFKKTMKIVGK